jgi:two-component system sensor histidine kinase ChvG
VALAPLLFVALGPLYEDIIRQQMRGELSGAVERVESVLSGGEGPRDERVEAKLREIAEDYDIWLRLVDADGAVAFDARHALGSQGYKQVLEHAAADSPDESHLIAYDAQRPAFLQRREFRRADEAGRANRCELAEDGRLLTCMALQKSAGADGRPLFIYAQDASIRGVRELAAERYPLFKLVLQVLGVSLVVAIGVGWWSVRPMEKLAEQVADRAEPPVSTRRIDVDARGEIGQLEEAFNDLLGALEERRQATKSYMADIAHEVKNPVAAIKTAAGRLESGDLGEERVERITRVLEDSTDRLDGLVTRFLELARAEAGLPDEARQPVEVEGLVEALVEPLEADERFADLALTVEADAATVHASPTHLEGALRNLLENGASFAESELAVRVERSDREATISVADDGPGIDPEDLPHVFDRFFSRRPGNEGTGLGLAMTRAVVEAHDGRIDVDSTLDEGTTFTIHLPRAPEA